MSPGTLAARLPAFTWDRIAPLGEKAGLHPDGVVDLSMGTPVDPVPSVVRDALAGASNAPGYPATWGTAALRTAAAAWLARALASARVSQGNTGRVADTPSLSRPPLAGAGP